MNQISFDPWMSMEHQRRQKELVKQVDQVRLAESDRNARTGKSSNRLEFLRWIGKELAHLGKRLDDRFSFHPDSQISMTGQGSQGGCS